MRPDADGRPPTLVAGVGYHDLRDFSVGPWLAQTLREMEWPEGVVVENLSYNPVAVVHRLQEQEPSFRRWMVGGAVQRGRSPGTVTAYRWDRRLPDEDEIQARVAEAVTGVVGLDNLLVVTAAFEAAPEAVVVVEVEPGVEELGHEFTAEVREGAEQACRILRQLALGRADPARLPRGPLGGAASGNGGAEGAADPPAPRERDAPPSDPTGAER